MTLALLFFAFWCVLSGKTDAFHLGLGVVSSLAAAWIARLLREEEPAIPRISWRSLLRWPFYLAWLMWQILLSSVQVARVVLHPRMPISPRLVRFRRRLSHPWARLTLANSITITPGTVTLDLHDNDYTVHALTAESAGALAREGYEGELPRRVALLFEEADE